MADSHSTVSYKPIEGFPGYRVGDDGTIWSCLSIGGRGPRRVTSEWRQLKIGHTPKGRPIIGLRRNGKTSWFQMSTLVLSAFVGPRPKGMVACYGPDRNVLNCRIDNLRWDTMKNAISKSPRVQVIDMAIKSRGTIIQVIPRAPSQIEYRSIDDHPGYRVGNDGTVWSQWIVGARPARRGQDWHQVGFTGSNGYRYATLRRDGGRPRQVLIHRLALTAFLGECPEGMEACHRSGFSLDNSLANLYWGTPASNQQDRRGHGTDNKGERHGLSVLTEDVVKEARRLYETTDMTHEQIAAHLGCKRRTIGRAIRGQSWRHV